MQGVRVVWAQWLLDCAASWKRLPETDYHLSKADESTTPPYIEPFILTDPTASTSTLPLEPEPDSELDSRSGSVAAEDLDIAGFDWGDAGKEVDDFLNESDDDDGSDAGETDVDTDGEGIEKGKKRAREDEEYNSSGIGSGIIIEKESESSTSKNVGSPLSKRIKKSKLRKSGLGNIAFDAGDREFTPLVNPPIPKDVPKVVVGEEEENGGSSVLDSDDEAFFASMANELEAGFT